MRRTKTWSILLVIVIALAVLLSSCDTYEAKRAAAEEEIRTAQVVKDNPLDGGIAALVEEYVARLATASDATAIRNVISEFEAAAEAHANAKADLLAELNAVDLSAFSASGSSELKEEVLAARDDAVLAIKTASTLVEAEAHLASYKTFVSDKLLALPMGPCDGVEGLPGMTEKVELLGLIDEYEERAQLLIQNLTTAYENGEISEEEYRLRMYGTPENEGGESVSGYEYALERIAWWKKYVTVAINIDGMQETFAAELDPLLEAPSGT